MHRVLCATAISLVLCGCTTSGGLFGGAPGRGDGESGGAAASIDTQALALYLEIMHDLITGDAVTRAEVFSSVEDEFLGAPTTTNRLKHALALAAPGHEFADADAASRELSELLAEDALLLPEERVLAVIELAEVERRLILEQRLRVTEQAASAEIRDQNTRVQAEAEQRVTVLEEEVRRLRAELAEAQEIIDEIANIERSLRERDNDPN